MRATLVFDADMAVLVLSDATGRVEVRGSVRVGCDAQASDHVQAVLNRLSGLSVSALFAGDTLSLSPSLPGRMSGDHAALKPLLNEDA